MVTTVAAALLLGVETSPVLVVVLGVSGWSTLLKPEIELVVSLVPDTGSRFGFGTGRTGDVVDPPVVLWCVSVLGPLPCCN